MAAQQVNTDKVFIRCCSKGYSKCVLVLLYFLAPRIFIIVYMCSLLLLLLPGCLAFVLIKILLASWCCVIGWLNKCMFTYHVNLSFWCMHFWMNGCLHPLFADDIYIYIYIYPCLMLCHENVFVARLTFEIARQEADLFSNENTQLWCTCNVKKWQKQAYNLW